MRQKSQFFLSLLAVTALLLNFFMISPAPAQAAISQDNTIGVYIDNFANATGLVTASKINANVNTGTGKLQLTNASNGFVAPFRTSGSVITTAIIPTSVVEWGTVSLMASTTASTTVRFHIADEDGTIYPDTYLAGNVSGLSGAATDISSVPFDFTTDFYDLNRKILRIKIKIDLSTIDPNVTPEIDSLTITWKPKADVLPTASQLNDSGWPTPLGDGQRTSHSQYAGSSDYYAIRWAGEKYPRGTYTSSNLIYGNNFIFGTYFDGRKFIEVDKNTGQTVLEKPFGAVFPFGTLTQEGILYVAEQWNDIMFAMDVATGDLKWTYQFTGGHGNDYIAIGSDGTLYTIRSTSSNDKAIAFAFNPDGTVKWQRDIPYGTTYPAEPGITPGIISGDKMYFGNVTVDANYNQINGGKLYAVNLSDGSVAWSYNTGDNEGLLTVDSSGTIYVGNYYSGKGWEPRIFAINPDGTLKWEKSYGNVEGFSSASLSSDGYLIARKVNEDFSHSELVKISTVDGTIVAENNADYYQHNPAHPIIVDANNAVMINAQKKNGDDKKYPLQAFYDSVLNLKWQHSGATQALENGIETVYDIMGLSQDERGWLYSTYTKDVHAEDWSTLYYDQNFTQPFALAPWTLAAQVSDSTPNPGDIITFTVTTSMQQTNLLTTEANKLQIAMENGDKLSLAYSSTDANGDTLWTGSYTVPQGTPAGTFDYTIEASAAGITTDIATNFTSPAANSNNTGLASAGSLQVNGSGGGLPAVAYNPPAAPVGGFKVVINNQSSATTGSNVTLSLTGGDNVTSMAISNTSDFKDAVLEPYTTTKAWNLCWNSSVLKTPVDCNPGLKTVYVKFYTSYGQASNPVSDEIIYQTGKGAAQQTDNNNQTLPTSFVPGTLVLDKGTIYLISANNTKQGFASMKAFTGLGYSLKNLTKGDTSAYTQATVLSSPLQAHPDGSWITSKKTVYYVSALGYIPIPSWDVFESNHGQTSLIIKANKADITDSRPVLPLMTVNDPRVGE